MKSIDFNAIETLNFFIVFMILIFELFINYTLTKLRPLFS